MERIILIIIVSFIVSCTPQGRINRLIEKSEKIAEKHNLLINVKDTVYHTEVFTHLDTFYIDSSQIIKKFTLNELHENQIFIIEDDLIKTTVTILPPVLPILTPEIVIDTKFKGKEIIKRDTIKISVPTYLDKEIILYKYRVKWYDYFFRIFFLGFLGFLFWLIIRRYCN